MEHTAQCQAQQAKAAEFKASHPKHCAVCQGHGMTDGGHDSGTGLLDCDPCEACVCRGFCPVCGAYHDGCIDNSGEWVNWDGESCECGWTWGGPPISPLSRYGCDCGIDEPITPDEIAAQRRAAEVVAQVAWDEMTEEEQNEWYAVSDFAYDAWRETGRRM